MAFQPFGYRFDLVSPLSPDAATAKIRARKKDWFDIKSGARGWIARRFICLWSSAFDSNGPMLFGRIAGDGSGTRISGRAGSNLNGVAMVALLIPVMLWLIHMMLAEGIGTGAALVVAGIFAVTAALVFWANHAFRRDADPLVRFLRDTVAPADLPKASTTGNPDAAGTKSTGATSGGRIDSALRLVVNGRDVGGPVTVTAIDQALRACDADDFLILESAAETYLQTLGYGHGAYRIEKRDGDRRQHFAAVRSEEAGREPPPGIFSLDEVLAVFLAYASGGAMPDVVTWKPIRV